MLAIRRIDLLLQNSCGNEHRLPDKPAETAALMRERERERVSLSLFYTDDASRKSLDTRQIAGCWPAQSSQSPCDVITSRARITLAPRRIGRSFNAQGRGGLSSCNVD